jgi:chloramphenicol-sensitive protein RarD
VAPILQLACAVLIFHEPMPAARLAGFGLVWIALIIFTVDGIRGAQATGRANREAEGLMADPTAATVEPVTALHPTGPERPGQGTS